MEVIYSRNLPMKQGTSAQESHKLQQYFADLKQK